MAGYPICFLHGRRAFRLTEPERKALAEYIQRGGFLFADAICANRQFIESFYREMKTIFPKSAMKRIPIDDPL
ncbi:MAG: DUF4159 domain-containing protein, partial [Chloroflexi bacterium]|nr:DUF4159 domain-containing protein [Chloroflexota bacterium]